ncbi:hypothetical protein L195_g024566, partial [Trifolium pratense]
DGTSELIKARILEEDQGDPRVGQIWSLSLQGKAVRKETRLSSLHSICSRKRICRPLIPHTQTGAYYRQTRFNSERNTSTPRAADNITLRTGIHPISSSTLDSHVLNSGY